MAKRQLSWNPLSRRGGIYCSPACGRGCTRAEFDRATRAADALARKLGGGFRPRVWENLGWHYAAELGRTATYRRALVEVHPAGRQSWTVYLNTDKQFVVQQTGGHPRDAVKDAVEKAGEFLAGMVADLDKARRAVETGGRRGR